MKQKLFMMPFLIIGCENDDETIPEYVGNWSENYWHHLELTEKTFKETNDEWNVLEDGSIEKSNTIKGNIILDDDSIFFIINKVRIEIYYPEDSININYGYDRGTEKFYEKYGEGFSSYRFAVGDDIFALYANLLLKNVVF